MPWLCSARTECGMQTASDLSGSVSGDKPFSSQNLGMSSSSVEREAETGRTCNMGAAVGRRLQDAANTNTEVNTKI